MMYEKRELYRAIAEVAYAIARVGDGLQSIERKKFYALIMNYLIMSGGLEKVVLIY